MTRDEFDALVKRLEAVSRRHPTGYVLRVTGWVVLAYAYLLVLLLGSLAAAVALVALVIAAPNAVTLKFAIIFGVVCVGLFWAIARGLWIRLEPPEGLPLAAAAAPALFAWLGEVRAELDCPPFHEVRVTGDYNAAVVQVPRLGILGWHRNYLYLGLPLLQGLAPDEFKAVLAHEFAHSSRGHGRFGNWLYRIRRVWDRIFQQLARQQNRGVTLLTGFLRWFWPRFNAHAFVLARANEYEADACSARLAGADAAARALVRLPVHGSWLADAFWADVYHRANTEPEPPAAAFTALGAALRQECPPEASARWLRHAFLAETNNSDTHPCLKDRLRALGRLPGGADQGRFPTSPPPVPTRTAAQVLLGETEARLEQQLSERWRQSIAPLWKERHARAQQIALELRQPAPPGGPPPAPAEIWEKAQRIIDLEGDEAAQPLITQVLQFEPFHAGANFVRGRWHLAHEDPAGVEAIERAMAADPMLTEPGCGLLHGHFSRTGKRDRLRGVEDRVDQHHARLAVAQQERACVTSEDVFLPHELPLAVLEPLRSVLGAEPDIAAAAVARKQVRMFPLMPAYVVCLKVRVAWWKVRSSQANQHLVTRLVNRIHLPGYFLVFVGAQNLAAAGKKVFAVPQALVFERGR